MADDKGVNWCELPEDILGSISQRLQYKDHIRLRMVCTSWRRPTHSTRPGDTFPWLFSLKDWCYGLFKPRKNLLYKYTILFVAILILHITGWITKQKQKCTSTSTLDLYSSRTTFRFALAVRFGWLVVRETCPCELLFLYNPFSLEVIELPGFPFTILGEIPFFVFTFSYCPELRRCMALWEKIVPKRTRVDFWWSHGLQGIKNGKPRILALWALIVMLWDGFSN